WGVLLREAGATTPVSLPTYAFQRRRYWLAGGGAGQAATGVAATAHPLLDGVVALADDRGWLFTGRLSLDAQPWLADHAVLGTVLLPGAALLELALHAGAEAGCDRLQELTLQTPIVLSEHGALQLQVVLEREAGGAACTIGIYSRAERGDGERCAEPGEWLRNASGVLVAGDGAALPAELDERLRALAGTWPPPAAQPLPVDDLYARLARAGFDYGETFQAVRAAWRDGERVLAELALPDDGEQIGESFALHPALLDAAFHVAIAAGGEGEGESAVPFTWSAAQLYGRGGRSLRALLSAPAEGEPALLLANNRGEPVASVGAVVSRPVSAAQLEAARHDSPHALLRLEWAPAACANEAGADAAEIVVLGGVDCELADALTRAGVQAACHPDLRSLVAALASGAAEAPDVALVRCPAPDVDAAPDALVALLELLQQWLAAKPLVGSRLALISSGAVAARPGEQVPAPSGAAAWGLVRSAQSEHPGRFALLDIDRADASWEALADALVGGEPQIALREGVALVPGLVTASATATHEQESAARPTAGGEPAHGAARASRALRGIEGTVLITGGLGGLGALVAERLVTAHGARRLLLVGRRGEQTPGAAELRTRLEGLGAEVQLAACDVADREQVAELLRSIPAEQPLRVVCHAAGVADNALVESLTEEQLQRVLEPKLRGAVNLDELTRELELDAFILFSSLAGVFGGPGQANYAAANAFLDGLAAQRQALGLVATSLAWGLWGGGVGLGGELGERDMRRLTGSAGLNVLAPDEALELFSAALAQPQAVVAPVHLDRVALRAEARAGTLPPLLRGLVRGPVRTSTRASRVADGLAGRLSGLSERERAAALRELVCDETAAVLGHASAAAVDAGATFKDLGFDSLAAVELRNRLVGVCGVRLPATLVFDFPTPELLVGHLLGVLGGSGAAAVVVRGAVGVDEPVAIVGMGCRFPGGVGSPQGLWDLVASGRDAISGFPVDRGWDLEGLFDPDPGVAGTSYVREGGFLLDAAEFDAEFFGVAPREALAMDPQQRLLLEVAWEALEDGGIDPFSLRGTPAGVFAGVMLHDYALGLRRSQAAELEGYLGTGGAGSVVSGRIAYTLGLEGPAVTVDTACSSSLVALHLACQALRSGECSLALAGGVTVLATPLVFIEFARQRGLAADGRCKSFAAGADGTAWSEGVGLLALERLSDARRNGRRVLGVVSGSAVNQDGASNGLTAPNGPSQQRVIGRALAVAGVAPGEVDVVEGHGTGTALGDPIEAQALIAAYGRGREVGRPLWLGSIKSNIGHAQAAAGVAGVIKMVMALRHGVLPRTLHVQEPSGEIDWGSGALALLREEVAWERGGRPRRAGVSSFGISGTNAHVILEEAPAEPATSRLPRPGLSVERTPATEQEQVSAAAEVAPDVALDERADDDPAPPLLPWIVSARGANALRAQARRLMDRLASEPGLDVADVGYSLASTRSVFVNRAVVLARDVHQLRAALAALADGHAAENLLTGSAPGVGALAYMFTGQGSQRPRMGRELYAAFPIFRDAVDELGALLDAQLREQGAGNGQPSVREAMFAEPGSPEADRLAHTTFAQPALFMLEVGLFRLLESWDLKPDFLIGHSIGELAAAHVAGVLDAADACTLVAARGQLMGALPAGGAMVAVQASEADVGEELAGRDDRVALAAVNGPSAVVLSGDEDAVLELAQMWRERGCRTRRLEVSHAFHSPRMDAMLADFAAVAAGLSFSAPRIAIVSNLTGEQAPPELLCSADYWVNHVRETVRFADGVRWLAAHGTRCLLELGPDGVLSALAQECLPEPVAGGPLLRGERPEQESLLGALASAWTSGAAEVDWGAVVRARVAGARRVALPTYAFQRTRYWPARGRRAGDLRLAGQAQATHPLLGAATELAAGEGWLFTGRVALDTHPWLADHAVLGRVLVPGAALLELALHVAERVGCTAVRELTLQAPLELHEGEAAQLQVAVGSVGETGARTIEIHSRPERHEQAQWQAQWRRHATGELVVEDAPEIDTTTTASWPPPHAEPLALDGLYERLALRGLDYGPLFQGLRAAWQSGTELFAEIALPTQSDARGADFAVHPALLDAALHATLDGEPAAAEADEAPADVRLPFSWSGVRLHGRAAGALRAVLRPSGADGVSLLLADESGTPVVTVDALVARPVSAEQLEQALAGDRRPLLRLEWVPVSTAATESARSEAIDVLVDCDAPPAEHSPEQASARLDAVLERLQAWLAEEPLAGRRLVFVTRGAVAAEPSEDVSDLVGAAIWGLVRAAQAEHPGRFVLVDVDEHEVSRATLAQALSLPEPQLAIRLGAARVPRLARVAVAEPATPAAAGPAAASAGASFTGAGTTLVTGGTGGLGALIAEHLVRAHGVRRLLLVSRSGPDAAGADALRERLQELGAHVELAACDVADRERLRELLAAIPREQPLKAVIHAAGVLDDGVLASLTRERLQQVLAPKLQGARNLHELTAGLELDAFVLFSSIAGVLGGAGQANYSAANAYLDALALHRRAHGLPAISMAWGLWETAAGMGGRLAERERSRLGRGGIAALSASEGRELFDAACVAGEAAPVNVKLDAGALRTAARAGSLPPPLRGLVRVPARARTVAGGELARRVRDAKADAREGLLLELVRGEAAAVLGHASAQAIAPDSAFRDLGFDSLAAVELRNRLAAATALRLSATLVFDHPTPLALARWLVGELLDAPSLGLRPAAALRRDDPVAIVGMSCRYPGDVASPADLWDLLCRGAEGIGDFPTDRGWQLERLADPGRPGSASRSGRGGFLYDATEFDAAFFGVSPRDALRMDPQQRLLLEAAWEALEDGGIDPRSLAASQTGVYVGLMYHDYAAGIDGYMSASGGGSVVAGGLAYTLGLQGPAVTIDTACSSSLVALHSAARALSLGECSLALAGGVTVMSTPGAFVEFSRQGALSADGRCRSFGASADGTSWSEGVGVLLLERLSDA
ncbi:MAG TPA: SDR family NAD(P)-dependent oxidoreductase, partial [Solirubrobacteraceae bacterium]|nr:SDR family NAD(P)-dependent oxidoreductase [Solirubrobacteraceae bacterium]